MIGRPWTGSAFIFSGSVLASGLVSRTAPGMCPASYSAASRASMNSAAWAAKNRCVVEGVNRVWKHVRPSQRNPQGGRIQKDAPIHLSNVMPMDPGGNNRGTRIRTEIRDGQKHRIAVRSGTDLGRIGKR